MMVDPRALCICGHYANEHYTFSRRDTARYGSCAARQSTVRVHGEPCDCHRFEAYIPTDGTVL